MNARNSKVTNGKWGVSTTRATGVPGVTLSVYVNHYGPKTSDGKYHCQKGDGDGLTFDSHEQADAYTLEHGYSKRYSRNTMEFVMSRAARKRGMTTDDWRYHSRRTQHA